MKSFPMKSLAYWGILAVKAANRISRKIGHKMTFIYKGWHEMLPFALQEYCTSKCTL